MEGKGYKKVKWVYKSIKYHANVQGTQHTEIKFIENNKHIHAVHTTINTVHTTLHSMTHTI